MKDIKIKPKTTNIPENTPKFAEKGSSPVKNVKETVRDRFIHQAGINPVQDSRSEQAERPENYATENIEKATYSAADTMYGKTKSYTENKVKERISGRLRPKNAPEASNIGTDEQQSTSGTCVYKAKTNTAVPQTADSIERNSSKKRILTEKTKVKIRQKKLEFAESKQSYIKTDKEAPDVAREQTKPGSCVKTKESYIRQHTKDISHSAKTTDAEIYRSKNVGIEYSAPIIKENEEIAGKAEFFSEDKTKHQAGKYAASKLKSKYRDGKADTQNIIADISETQDIKAYTSPFYSEREGILAKTKESYMKREGKSITPTNKDSDVLRIKPAHISDIIKAKPDAISYPKNTKMTFKAAIGSKRSTVKAKKAAARTQKEISKKAAKEAAKQAKAASQKTVQVTKAVAKTAVKITVKAAKAVAHAVKTLVSEIIALGGWAVLLVVLIIIIIVAAIAASPFGIFISDEAADAGSIPISSIVSECNIELSEKLDSIENSANADRIVTEGEQANWSEILAVFAVKTAGTDDETAEDVVVITEEKKQKLKDLFWHMNSISSRIEDTANGDRIEKILYITFNHKTKDDMALEYGFTQRQREALATLLENSTVLIGETQSLAVADATAQAVLRRLPEGLSQSRKNVIKAACSLVGKVQYFWGGKSSVIGWDSDWGKMALVTAEGSRSSGSMRPYGLDCSGFVTWCFINAGKTGDAIGYGTQGQIAGATRIAWDEVQPGDLAFLADISHVGIVAGRDDSGNILIIHCSSSANNVVITTNSIFAFAARPGCYFF